MGSTPTTVGNAAQRLQSLRLRYPGLLPEETLVLRAWLTLNEAQFDRFDYNVRIGPDQDPGPIDPRTGIKLSDAVRRDAILSQKLRIDAVGWRGVSNDVLPPSIDTPSQVYALFPSALATIIEVKRRATASAVGQLLTYWHMWITENPDAAQPDLLLVCNTYTPNIVPALKNDGIQLNTVAVDFSILKPVKG